MCKKHLLHLVKSISEVRRSSPRAWASASCTSPGPPARHDILLRGGPSALETDSETTARVSGGSAQTKERRWLSPRLLLSALEVLRPAPRFRCLRELDVEPPAPSNANGTSRTSWSIRRRSVVKSLSDVRIHVSAARTERNEADAVFLLLLVVGFPTSPLRVLDCTAASRRRACDASVACESAVVLLLVGKCAPSGGIRLFWQRSQMPPRTPLTLSN